MTDPIIYRRMDTAPKNQTIWVKFEDGIERLVSWWDCSWLRQDHQGLRGDVSLSDCWVDELDNGETHEVYDAQGWRPSGVHLE